MPYGRRSARTVPLPKGWAKIRARILKRDGYMCVEPISVDGTLCGRPATDVDHIDDPGDHGDHNLRALCAGHHKARSSRQGGLAAAARRAPRTRPADPHPGLINGPRHTPS
jgi:hypothetical protein